MCARRTQSTGAFGGAMCSRCSRSLDRFQRKDSSIGGLMQWTAKRARAGAKGEAVTSGYLSAVSTALRIDHDSQTAQQVLRAGGIDATGVRSAGLTQEDEDLLIRAIER